LGQIVAFASLSAEGAVVATKRYLVRPIARVLVTMRLGAHRISDESGNPEASVVWQDIRAAGDPALTW
jgi:hypothetical protein